MATTLYREKQRFNNIPLLAILGVCIAGLLYLSAMNFFTTEGSDITGLISLLMALGLALTTWWLTRLRLKVSITDKVIKYKMSPFHPKRKKIRWKDVEHCEIVKTPPAAQWHVGNISYTGATQYSLSGRNGLYLETKDGRRYFIGCKKVNELKDSLDNVCLD